MADNDFNHLCNQLRQGNLTPTSHQVEASRISPYTLEQSLDVTSLSDEESQSYHDIGLAALREGRLGRIILNGGMATRFGGLVKALVNVYDDENFLDLKLKHAFACEQAWQVPAVPVALMTSFATDGATREAVAESGWYGRDQKDLSMFLQSDFPRLDLEAGLTEPTTRDDRAACGHGDFLFSFLRSGLLDQWLGRGVTHIDFSNIDNLGATLDPRLFGMVLKNQAPMAIEVARKEKDKGGAACLLDGRPTVLEGPYFPADFDHDSLPLFNTNNLWFDLKILKRLAEQPAPLPWHLVVKEVEHRKVGQFERFAIDACRHLDGAEPLFLTVARDGPQGRFFPIKSVDDLEQNRSALKERLAL